MQQFFSTLLFILVAINSLFLICLILIQRGKGGGLAGAFGGAGGSSAFGTKAGDVFTRVTMIAAGVWIALNMLLVVVSNRPKSAWNSTPGASSDSGFVPSKDDAKGTDKDKGAAPAADKATGKDKADPGKAGPAVDVAPADLPPPPTTSATKPSTVPPVEVSGGSPGAPVAPQPIPDAGKPAPKP